MEWRALHIVLWLFLQNAGCFSAWTISGCQTPIRCPWMKQANTLGSSSDARKLEVISSQSLGKPCWQIPRGMLLISNGSQPGTWHGQSILTLQWLYKRHGPHLFRQMKSCSSSGVHYTIQPGFPFSGRYSEQRTENSEPCSSPAFWTRWISSVNMEQGGTRTLVISTVCIGRTGRAWKFKQSQLRRRRSLRRRKQASLKLSRRNFLAIFVSHLIYLVGLDMCPGFSCHTCAALKLMVSRILWTCCMAQQLHSPVIGLCADMSESDEDAPWRVGPSEAAAADGPRPPTGPPPPAGPPPPRPAGPAGPPRPSTVSSWMGLSHAYSQAVAGVLNAHYATAFRGSILTYLPAELQTPWVGLQDIVVSIRPLRPHEREHPLILHIQDDEADAVEETEAEGHHGDSATRPDRAAEEEEDEDGPAYYYADTMMPISEALPAALRRCPRQQACPTAKLVPRPELARSRQHVQMATLFVLLSFIRSLLVVFPNRRRQTLYTQAADSRLTGVLKPACRWRSCT